MIGYNERKKERKKREETVKVISMIQASCGYFKTMNWIGGLNGCKRKFNITTIKLLQKSSNFQLLLSLCSRFPGTKTTHTKCNHKETTSMQSICTGNNELWMQ